MSLQAKSLAGSLRRLFSSRHNIWWRDNYEYVAEELIREGWHLRDQGCYEGCRSYQALLSTDISVEESLQAFLAEATAHFDGVYPASVQVEFVEGRVACKAWEPYPNQRKHAHDPDQPHPEPD